MAEGGEKRSVSLNLVLGCICGNVIIDQRADIELLLFESPFFFLNNHETLGLHI